MGGFVGAVLGFPTVLFTFLLVVVIGYWVLVLLGAMETETFDGDGGDAQPGLLTSLGLGEAPLTVVLSLLIALAWFVSLAGTVLLSGLSGGVRAALSILTLVVALALAWLGTRLLLLPLRRLWPGGAEASRSDFVGSLCLIRTGRVGEDFGQAEVTAADGSSAVIQVRQAGPSHGDGHLVHGATALIYDYDVDGEFFWVVPADAALDPPHPL